MGRSRSSQPISGKRDFFLVGEIPDDDFASRYLSAVGRNLNASARHQRRSAGASRSLARGTGDSWPATSAASTSDRRRSGLIAIMGDKLMSVLDDHDHVYGEKLRFAARAVNDHQSAAAMAVQLLTLGIPCLYYGTEQGFAGPEAVGAAVAARLGQLMIAICARRCSGPASRGHQGRAGVPGLGAGDGLDHQLPGFGPFGTAGAHCFDPDYPLYRRTAAITAIRADFPVLRSGRQYLRPVSVFGEPFGSSASGRVVRLVADPCRRGSALRRQPEWVGVSWSRRAGRRTAQPTRLGVHRDHELLRRPAEQSALVTRSAASYWYAVTGVGRCVCRNPGCGSERGAGASQPTLILR